MIGWSLGAVYARELAKRAPDAVRCAITPGTPFTGHPKARSAWRCCTLSPTGSCSPRASGSRFTTKVCAA